MNICEYTEGLHEDGVLYAPLQQYSGFENASHALRQAVRPTVRSSDGQIRFRSVTHPVVAHMPDPPVASITKGRL